MTARIHRQDRDPHPAAATVGSDAPRAFLGPRAPEPIAVGAGSAVLIEGTLEAGAAPPGRLALRLGAGEEVEAGSAPTPGGPAGSRAWWALVPIPAQGAAGEAPLTLILDPTGDRVELALGALELAPAIAVAAVGAEEAGGPDHGPLIAICMASFEPAADRLRRQLDSIREQSWQRWICVISDDGSSAQAFAEVERAVADDPRFVVSRSPERRGFLRNFERAISMAPAEAELIALADQDDRWHPDKLEALLETLEASPRAELAYSDMRILDGDGRVLSETYWYLRRNRCEDMASLLVANVVTGAASLLRRRLLDDALPFPPAHPSHALYHDHWLALCALATGEVAYLDRPTHDYFRHEDSVTVIEAPEWLRPQAGFAGRLRLHWGRATRRLRMGSQAPSWETVYHERWLLIGQLAAVLELRLGGRMRPRARRQIHNLLAAEHSSRYAALLLLRCLRPLIGRNETLARERVLLGGLIWRWRTSRRTAQR